MCTFQPRLRAIPNVSTSMRTKLEHWLALVKPPVPQSASILERFDGAQPGGRGRRKVEGLRRARPVRRLQELRPRRSAHLRRSSERRIDRRRFGVCHQLLRPLATARRK